MYDPTLPLNFGGPLHAAAIAADNAQNHKFEDVTDPLASTLGDMPRVRLQQYRSGICASALAYARGTHVVAAFAGIQGATDAMRVYQGWLSPTSVQGFQGKVNEYAKTWWENGYEFVESLNTQTATDYLFVGHSWGATVATFAAIRIKRFRPSVRVRLVTLGAPRFADAAFLNQLQGIDFMRVHASLDIIPCLCPWFSEAASFHVQHGPLAILAMNSYTHMGNGMFIKRQEQPQMRERSPGEILPQTFHVAAMRSILAGGLTPHYTTNYVSILRTNVYDTNPRLHNAEGTPTNERALPWPNVTPQVAEAIAAYPRLPWPANAVAKGQPPAQEPQQFPELLPKPVQEKGPRVRIRQYAGIWGVFIDGILAYKATSKRDARGVAKAIRTIGVQVFQNPTGFTDPHDLLYAAAGFMP